MCVCMSRNKRDCRESLCVYVCLGTREIAGSHQEAEGRDIEIAGHL